MLTGTAASSTCALCTCFSSRPRPLHPQPVEVDTHHLGIEIAARGNDTLNVPSPDAGVVGSGIGKSADCTRGHLLFGEASSWIDIEAGLAKSGILRMPPDFCANAPWPPSQSGSAVMAATAILHECLIIALRAVGMAWTQLLSRSNFQGKQ